MSEMTSAEKARAARAFYARERRRNNPDVKAREKASQERHWERYFEEVVRPALDSKIEAAAKRTESDPSKCGHPSAANDAPEEAARPGRKDLK